MKKLTTVLMLFMILLVCCAMDLATFNKGTKAEDWKDAFPLLNKGRFEMKDGIMKLSLEKPNQCARYTCSLQGLPPGKLMYFSFYASGENIKSAKDGFMGYLRNRKFNFVTSISPAGTGWKWATGSFDRQLFELYFKVPSDGNVDVFFELRGDSGAVTISDIKILPLKRKDIKKAEFPVAMTMLPTEWLKDSVALLQDIPAIYRLTFKGDGQTLKNKPVHLEITHPEFVDIVSIEHRWLVKRKDHYAFPELKCLQSSSTKHVYLIPTNMVAGFQKNSIAWDNELFLNMKSNAPAGAKGKMNISVVSDGKVLATYNFSVSSIGELPKNRKAAKNFRTIIGYPHTAGSPNLTVRNAYTKFWKSMTSKAESFFIHRIYLHAPEVRDNFSKNYIPGIMIGGTNSLPLFHTLRKMPNNNYPKLLNDAEKEMFRGGFPLPSVKYVIDDPDNFIWDKVLPEEIRYRSYGMFDKVRFVCYDFEPSLLFAGFCEENRKWFSEWAKMSSVPSTKDIIARHFVKWSEFRRMQNEMIIQRFAAAMKKHFPHIEFRYCSDPLSSSGQPSSWCANDPRLSVNAIEVFQNMPYFAGTEYFEIIKANTEILGKTQYPLIDPSEFHENFFRRYSAAKVAQNIIATAGLNNIGIGFWRQDCFDGTYLLEIAKGFAAVAEIEDIIGKANAVKGLTAVAQNCLLKKLDDKSGFSLEVPNLSKNLRTTFHIKGNSAAAIILNYNDSNTVIAKCSIPGMPNGKYYVYDVFAKKSYGIFSNNELSAGILVSIPQLQTAVLKITAIEKDVKVDITQAQLKAQIKKDVAKLQKEQNIFQNLRSGNTEINWTSIGKGHNIAIRLSTDKVHTYIEPDTAIVSILKNTEGQDSVLSLFGDLIIEGIKLEITPKYTLKSSKIENDTAILKFDTMLRAEDSTNPYGFPLAGLKISKTYQLKGNRLDLIVELKNCSPEKKPISVQCRLRSITTPNANGIKELSGQTTPIQLLLRSGKQLTLPWVASAKIIPWNSNSIDFTGRMQYLTSSNIIASYFWRGTGIITAEPVTEKMTLRYNESKKVTVSVILP